MAEIDQPRSASAWASTSSPRVSIGEGSSGAAGFDTVSIGWGPAPCLDGPSSGLIQVLRPGESPVIVNTLDSAAQSGATSVILCPRKAQGDGSDRARTTFLERPRSEEAVPVILGGLVAFALVIGWALLSWQRSGRDPSYLDDASILLPAPPDGMTAATATIVDGGPAPTAFMAALLDLASRDEIAFRDETPDATGAHRVGIEIHGVPTDDPRVGLNRRRPVGEGEAWLLANLRSFASVGVAGFGQDASAMATAGAMPGFISYAAGAIAGGSRSVAPGATADGMFSGPTADPQALVLTAITVLDKPGAMPQRGRFAKRAPTLDLMRDLMSDPAAVAADPQAFARRFEASTGRAPTAAEMDGLMTWLHASQGGHVPAVAGQAHAAQPEAAAPAPAQPITLATDASIPADRAVAFHPPIGFATFVESYARRKGWITGFSFISRWKWHGRAAAEVVIGLIVAITDGAAQTPIQGAGYGIAVGGIATWFIAPHMASRTHQGAVMKAQLAAYRRTLKKTFDSSATLDDAVTLAGMAWLETPDKALVWGVALGLRPEIEALLRRTTNGMSAGTVATTAFLPRWVGRATQALAPAVPGMAEPPTPAGESTPLGGSAAPPTSGPASAPVRDYADVFAGIARIGTGAAPVATWSQPPG
jgi:hypothetical protein